MSASQAQRAVTAKRRADAVKLKLAGMEYPDIAERLGYSSRQAARKDVERAMIANLAEANTAVDDLRHVERMRLDRLQAAAWPQAMSGDLKAIETCLKIIAERRKLLGLDAPTKVEVITLDALDEEIRRLEAELNERAEVDEGAAAAGVEE